MDRTFSHHEKHGALHGITVLVETRDGRMIVGRCHEANDRHVLLLDADTHEGARESETGQAWLDRATRWGVFAKIPTLDLPMAEVASVTPLGDLAQA